MTKESIKRRPLAEDRIISHKVKTARKKAGIPQTELADHLGITYQQLQKYEKGTNRNSAGRLMAIAKALGKTVSFFFDNIEEGHQALPSQHQRMCIELSRSFMKIKNPAHQNAINFLVKTLANN